MSLLKNEILFKKFEILSCYKKDDHSAVYLANHIYLEKKVFLKILNTITITDSSVTERFKREAKILAKLEHPNIIKVFDFGMYKDHFYISFEYFESKNLRELWTSVNLTDKEKKEIFIQLVKGLKFAHSRKVIHRDIKPENILINKNNEVKLTDFGLAQLSIDSFITQKYSVVGTPAYMSPEQIQGDNLTFQSDLFSLGIVATELFCGKNPLLGKDTNETINNIISFDEKNNKDLFQNNDADIQKVLIGLLASNPTDRFESCSDIFKIFNIEPISINENESKSKRKHWLIIGIVLSSLIVILIVNYFDMPVEAGKVIKKLEESKTEKLINKYDSSKIVNSSKKKTKPENSVEIENQTKNLQNIKTENNAKPQTVIQNNEIGFGELYVRCYPWAKVYLDSKFFETTPFSKNISVNTGKYLITLIHPDYPEYSDSIIIASNELSAIEINLDTLFSYFECQVYPWSEIYIDGKKRGITPLSSPIRLGEGVHKLTLKNPQFKNFETIINTKKNDTLKLEFNINDYN